MAARLSTRATAAAIAETTDAAAGEGFLRISAQPAVAQRDCVIAGTVREGVPSHFADGRKALIRETNTAAA